MTEHPANRCVDKKKSDMTKTTTFFVAVFWAVSMVTHAGDKPEAQDFQSRQAYLEALVCYTNPNAPCFDKDTESFSEDSIQWGNQLMEFIYNNEKYKAQYWHEYLYDRNFVDMPYEVRTQVWNDVIQEGMRLTKPHLHDECRNFFSKEPLGFEYEQDSVAFALISLVSAYDPQIADAWMHLAFESSELGFFQRMRSRRAMKKIFAEMTPACDNGTVEDAVLIFLVGPAPYLD